METTQSLARDTFAGRLRARMNEANSLVCVGLDPDLRRFPADLAARSPREAIVAFNAAVIEATAECAAAYKPNVGFYVSYGLAGLEALIETRRLIPSSIPVILDCKVGDMDNTAAAYARGYFDEWGFDAITANPFLGEDSLVPFFRHPERGVFVLCKTSNPGSGDLQDLTVQGGQTLAETVAGRVAVWSTRYPASLGLVVGATYPAQVARIRALCPDHVILLPGVGAQGGDVAAAVAAGVDAGGAGLLVNSTRGIIYASQDGDFADRSRDAARALRDQINAHRPTGANAPAT